MKSVIIELKPETRWKGVGVLAKRMGVTSQHLSMCLHGRRKPGKALARKLKRLGIEVGEGMGAKGEGEGEGEGMKV